MNMSNYKKINDIFTYAKKNVDYYRNYDSFFELPLLTKEYVQRHYDEIISKEYNDFFKRDQLSLYYTSGSTGKCLKVFWDKNQYNKSLFYLWYYRKKYYEIYPNDKLITFYSTTYFNNNLCNINNDYIEFENAISFSKRNLSQNRIVEIYYKILEFSPKWIIIQPSILELIIYYAKKNSLPSIESIKYIECTGEYLSDELKKKAEIFLIVI